MNYERPEHDALAEAYQILNNAITDENFREFVDAEGPLRVADVYPELRQSAAFSKFVGEFGWPSSLEDGDITPAPEFKDDADFYYALTQGAEVDGKNYYLNNFKVWLAAAPNTDEFCGGTSLYGSSPALLRAYLLEPEFMQALSTAYNSLPKSTYYPSAEALASKEGELVVKGSHMAYKLLARLLKKTDRQTHSKILFPDLEDHTSDSIDDAATYLAE